MARKRTTATAGNQVDACESAPAAVPDPGQAQPASSDWQRFSTLIEALYREAYAEASWTASLRLLALQFEARQAVLLVQDASGPLRIESAAGELHSEGSESPAITADPMPGISGETPVLHNHAGDTGAPRTGKARRETPRVPEIEHLLGFNVRGDGGLVYAFRLLRGPGDAGFTAADSERCRSLIAHVRSAVHIRRTIVSLQTERILLGRAVNRSETGVITLDRHGLVLELNDWSRAMLRESPQVYMEERRIFLRDLEDDRRWNNMLRSAIAGSREARRSRTLGAMPVHDDSGHTRLGLLLRSIPQKQSAKDPLSPAFALYLRDALNKWVAPSETIRKLFGITAAEASLTVHIARGLSIQEAATEMAISPNTAKSHLQAIFVKLGISRQADLVRIALSSVAAIG